MREGEKVISVLEHRYDGRPIRRFIASDHFAKVYVITSLFVLFGSVLIWSLLAAHVHSSNSDQLVNSYLFERVATLKGAMLPGAHTFLLKWPLFWLIKTIGLSASTFSTMTAAVTVVTVGGLAFLLHKIDHRPLVFGTMCLALASVLMLVPAQPYAGAILPVNMAMITTRNLEYLVFIAALGFVVHARALRSKKFAVAVGLLTVLLASDKLFLTISFGGALLALVCYTLAQRWRLANIAARWLAATTAAAVLATGLLWAVDALNITHIVNSTGSGPYGLVQSGKSLALGCYYAITGLLTNFGANPAAVATTVREMPRQAVRSLIGIGGLAYLINLGVLIVGLLAALGVMGASFKKSHNGVDHDSLSLLAILLLWATIAAAGAFAVTNHDYVVDARYLTISVFAVFTALAVVLRNKRLRSEFLILTGAVLIVGNIFGLAASLQAHNDSLTAQSNIDGRNLLVAQALSYHSVSVLVGDYWRVVPTKLVSSKPLNIMPLSDCTTPRSILSSSEWQPNLGNQSFAYLLSLDKGLTDFPTCSLQQVVTKYGRPNTSLVIEGSVTSPKEVLLFYDHGTNASAPATTRPEGPATVVPVAPEDLPYTTCSVPTIMNFVAHQDDDLLFMNPDTLNAIKAGHCVRTVFITAGDAGFDKFYWVSRQQGSEAAYSKMLGSNEAWVQRIVRLGDNEFITIANPRGNSKISLIFFNLPDGNQKGEGFKAYHNENIEKLESGAIKKLNAIYGESTYTNDQLIEALTTLMHTYQPTEIRSQSTIPGKEIADHYDHNAVGRYVQKAAERYDMQQFENVIKVPVKFYLGYPARALPENVSGPTLDDKRDIFFAYGKFDAGVCHNREECAHTPTYDNYLKRQYQVAQ